MNHRVDQNVKVKDREGYYVSLNQSGIPGPEQRHMDVRHVGSMIT